MYADKCRDNMHMEMLVSQSEMVHWNIIGNGRYLTAMALRVEEKTNVLLSASETSGLEYELSIIYPLICLMSWCCSLI